MIPEESARTAAQCRHYAMCKIDFLGLGLCEAGEKHHFVAYYPQGRMDIVRALAADRLPVTERLVEIAETCTLCGKCDPACYFVTELRPMEVMRSLKEHVAEHLRGGRPIEQPDEDAFLRDLCGIVGSRQATNDPAVLAAYAHDPGPMTGIQTPAYVIMPGSREEISLIVRLCRDRGVEYAVRGNGSSVMGFVFAPDGLVMDLGRMKKITIDRDNWVAAVEPGVSAFELQQEAFRHGLRANVSEPSALVCANLMCSGIFSPFSHAYGVAADNYVNAEFVGEDGGVFDLNQRDAPNLFGFQRRDMPSPGICTRADVKLYPRTDDEAGVLVPFTDFEEAAAFARELGRRRVGLAVAVLGVEYMAAFISPTSQVAAGIRKTFTEDLGIAFAVLVIGDRYALETVRAMSKVILDGDMLRRLMLGLPAVVEENWIKLLGEFEGDRPAYELLLSRDLAPLWEAALRPSPERLAETVPPGLREDFQRIFTRPEMTDIVWLNMFRIISSRMGRDGHVVAFVLFVPLDDLAGIAGINAELLRIAERWDLRGDYGFLTPLDFGKRAVLEYDYYLDHTRPEEVERMLGALGEAGEMLERRSHETPGFTWIRYLLHQGFCRKEHFLYI